MIDPIAVMLPCSAQAYFCSPEIHASAMSQAKKCPLFGGHESNSFKGAGGDKSIMLHLHKQCKSLFCIRDIGHLYISRSPDLSAHPGGEHRLQASVALLGAAHTPSEPMQKVKLFGQGVIICGR